MGAVGMATVKCELGEDKAMVCGCCCFMCGGGSRSCFVAQLSGMH